MAQFSLCVYKGGLKPHSFYFLPNLTGISTLYYQYNIVFQATTPVIYMGYMPAVLSRYRNIIEWCLADNFTCQCN